MENFIDLAIEYIDPHQPYNFAHTCRFARDIAQRARRVRTGRTTVMMPFESALARSSLTSFAGLFDSAREKCCHPDVAKCVRDNDMSLIARAACKYDDIEFARAILAFASRADCCNAYAYSAVLLECMQQSIPCSQEFARIRPFANRTQCARILALVCSREVTSCGRTWYVCDWLEKVIVYALCADNVIVSRALLDSLAGPIDLRAALFVRLPVSHRAVRICETHKNVVPLRRDDYYCIDTDDPRDILSIIAADLRDHTRIRSILDTYRPTRETIGCCDIPLVCCYANRADALDILVGYLEGEHVMLPLRRAKIDTAHFVQLRDIALRHVDDYPNFMTYVALQMLHSARFSRQIRAIMTPDAIASFARHIARVYVSHADRDASNIGSSSAVGDLNIAGNLDMYNIAREFGFSFDRYDSIIVAIAQARNAHEIEYVCESCGDITHADIADCMEGLRAVTLASRYAPICTRALDDESIQYLVGRVARDESHARNVFMLGMILNCRAMMLDSRYKLRASDITRSFVESCTRLYARDNPPISEFFDEETRLDCYTRMVIDASTYVTTLFRELSARDAGDIISRVRARLDDRAMFWVELIASTLVRNHMVADARP